MSTPSLFLSFKGEVTVGTLGMAASFGVQYLETILTQPRHHRKESGRTALAATAGVPAQTRCTTRTDTCWNLVAVVVNWEALRRGEFGLLGNTIPVVYRLSPTALSLILSFLFIGLFLSCFILNDL